MTGHFCLSAGINRIESEIHTQKSNENNRISELQQAFALEISYIQLREPVIGTESRDVLFIYVSSCWRELSTCKYRVQRN